MYWSGNLKSDHLKNKQRDIQHDEIHDPKLSILINMFGLNSRIYFPNIYIKYYLGNFNTEPNQSNLIPINKPVYKSCNVCKYK